MKWDLLEIDKLKKLIVAEYNGKPIYLEEVAKIVKGFPDIEHYTFVSKEIRNKFKSVPAVFVWVAKQVWQNEVTVDHKIKKILAQIQKNCLKI